MDYDFWLKQSVDTPLFPDIEWNKPENKKLAGKLTILGGNKLGFAGVANCYQVSKEAGVGEIRIVLPDILKKAVPPIITEAIFGPTNQSGSLSKDAEPIVTELLGWSDALLMAGDAGRSSETAIVYENILNQFKGQLTITRDAVDLIKNSSKNIITRPDTLAVVSFAQLQKLFQSVYYPKVLTFNMQLINLVDALHKFTITYPINIMTLHGGQLIVASGGKITTTPWDSPIKIWRGDVAARAASYWLWNQTHTLEALTASLVKNYYFGGQGGT